MMRTALIACRTLENELTHVIEETGNSYELIYIESGLHERPQKLSQVVQETLDCLTADRVILCLGQCGNAMLGIHAGNFEMILPRVDDCLSLLIGSPAEKSRLSVRDGAFFLTMGWLQGERTIAQEYARVKKRYGKKRAVELLSVMYAHYRTIGLLNTGVDSMDALHEATAPIAKLLQLEQKEYPASLDYIRILLNGPWDADRFIVKKAGESVVAADYQS